MSARHQRPVSPSFFYTLEPDPPPEARTHPPKRVRDCTLQELWARCPRRQRVVEAAAAPRQEVEDTRIRVVDLFCGCGGFSCGAEQAGHRVVLAVDCDKAALNYHKVNHINAKHALMVLGPETEERLLELIRAAVPEGAPWHLHGSPPCTLFSPMRNLTKGLAARTGMQLVEWYIGFVKRANPTTWTFENVRHRLIRDFMVQAKVEHGYFNFVHYGVPQTRKRCLAGTKAIIKRFSTDRRLLVTQPRTPRNVTPIPQGASLVRASGGKCTAYFYRSVDEPTWALLCACKPVWASAQRKCVGVMRVREILRIQTFPDTYRMGSKGILGSFGTEGDRVRLVGNAVPPLIASKLMQALRAAPTRWRAKTVLARPEL